MEHNIRNLEPKYISFSDHDVEAFDKAAQEVIGEDDSQYTT
jgi:hypothetical protein